MVGRRRDDRGKDKENEGTSLLLSGAKIRRTCHEILVKVYASISNIGSTTQNSLKMHVYSHLVPQMLGV